MLVAALPFLPEEQKHSVAEEAALLARREPEDLDRVRRLLDVAEALDGPARERLVSEAVPPGEPPSAQLDAWSLLRAWQLDPARTDAANDAVREAEMRADGTAGQFTVAHLAANAPASNLSRVRRMARRLAEPADRLTVLLALAERGYQPLDTLVREAEAELTGVAPGRVARQLDARLTPFRSGRRRAASVHATVTDDGQGPHADRLLPLLTVLPFTMGDDRDSAERQVFAILEDAGGEEAESLVSSMAGRWLRETEHSLFGAFVQAALSSVKAIEDPRSRVSGLVELLPELPVGVARAVLQDEARRILRIDDQRQRSECLATFAAHLKTGAAERAVGGALQRMVDRMPASDLSDAAIPLLAYAAAPDIAAFQAAVGDVDRFTLDDRPALFAAWARHGNWEAALDALDGGSPYEVERAVDPLTELIPEAVAEQLVGFAVQRGDPKFYSAVVKLVPRLPLDLRKPVAELGLQAIEALDEPYECLRLIERLAPLLPMDALPRIADLIPDGTQWMDRDPARLAITRAWIVHGDRIKAADEALRIEVAEYAAQALLEVARVSPQGERAEWLAAIEHQARVLYRTAKVETLVGSARLREEPERTRLLQEAVRAAEAHDDGDSLLSDDRAAALRIVAAAHEGNERQRLMLEAWDAAPRGDSWRGVGVLTALGSLIAEGPPSIVRPRWEGSLEMATRSRSATLQELMALAEVVVALGGPRTVAEVVSALDDIDRWWP